MPEAVRQVLFGAIIVVVAAAYRASRARRDRGPRALRGRRVEVRDGLPGCDPAISASTSVRRTSNGPSSSTTPALAGAGSGPGPDRSATARTGSSPLGEVELSAMSAWPGIVTAGVGIRACTTRAGHDPLPRQPPRGLDGRPVVAPVSAALGVPVALINDSRAFGLADCVSGGRGASSLVGLDRSHRRRRRDRVDGKVPRGTRHGRRDRTSDDRSHGPSCNCGNHGCLEAFARADRIASACGTATAEEAVEKAGPRPGGDRRPGAGGSVPGDRRNRQHDHGDRAR